MSTFRKAGIAVAMGGLVVAGSAVGGGLMSAGAATTPPAGTSGSNLGAFHSNENATHEGSESAAREAAEDNGTAGFGRAGGPGRGAFHPNEDKAHEASESAAREQAENDGTAGPPPGASDTAPPAASGSASST
jgi:hypothetical protein